MELKKSDQMTVNPPADGEIRVNGGPWTSLPVTVKPGDKVETRPRPTDPRTP